MESIHYQFTGSPIIRGVSEADVEKSHPKRTTLGVGGEYPIGRPKGRI